MNLLTTNQHINHNFLQFFNNPFLVEIFLFIIFSSFCLYLCYTQTKTLLFKTNKITLKQLFSIDETIFSKYLTISYLLIFSSILIINYSDFINLVIIINNIFLINNFNYFFKIILFFINFLFLINFKENFLNNSASSFFYLLLSIFFLSTCLILISIDFFYLYCFIELLTMIFYSLMLTTKTKSSVLHSTLTYLLYNIIITFFLVYSFLIFNTLTPSLHFYDIYYFFCYPIYNFLKDPYLFLAFNLVLIFFFYKLALAPFIFWIKDVYTGLPFSIAGFININTKLIFFFIFIKIIFTFQLFNLFFFSLNFLGISSIIIGSFITYYQNSFKTFIIYSSISHFGYLILCISQIFESPNNLSIENIFLLKAIFEYFLYYIFILTILWICLNTFTEYLNYSDIEFNQLSKYFKYHPIESFLILICLLSLGGLPPTYIFFLKYSILQAIFQTNTSIFFIILIGYISLISSFYYLKIIKIIFIDSKSYIYYFNKFFNQNEITSKIPSFTNINYNIYLVFFFFSIITLNAQLITNFAIILTYYII